MERGGKMFYLILFDILVFALIIFIGIYSELKEEHINFKNIEEFAKKHDN